MMDDAPQAVTDPALLAKLNGPEGGAPDIPQEPDPDAPQPVTDPAVLARLNESPLAPPTEPEHESAQTKVEAMGQMARAAAQNSGADIVAGWSGLQQMVTNAIGITSKPAADVVRDQQAALSYTPTKKVPEAVQKTAEFIGTNVENMKRYMGDWALEETNSPMIATMAYMIPDAVMTITGARAPGEAAEAATRGAAKVAEEATLVKNLDMTTKTAVGAGFRLPPSLAGGPIGRGIEWLTGAGKLHKEMSSQNADAVHRLAKLDMGMSQTDDLDKVSFATARFKAAEPYRQAEQLPRIKADQDFFNDVATSGQKFQAVERDFPDAVPAEIHKERGAYLQQEFEPKSALQLMSNLREDSALMLRSQNVMDRHVGAVKRDIAVALESQLERHAIANGRPDWAAQFSAARKKLAKIHLYDDATDYTTGHVSAKKVSAGGKLMDRRKGNYLDGQAKIIADSADAFPQVFQDVKGHTSPLSTFDYWVLVGTVLHGAATGETMGTGAAVVGGATMARAGARRVMASKPYQKMFSKQHVPKQGMLGQATGALGDTPVAEGLGAISGAELGGEGQE